MFPVKTLSAAARTDMAIVKARGVFARTQTTKLSNSPKCNNKCQASKKKIEGRLCQLQAQKVSQYLRASIWWTGEGFKPIVPPRCALETLLVCLCVCPWMRQLWLCFLSPSYPLQRPRQQQSFEQRPGNRKNKLA